MAISLDLFDEGLFAAQGYLAAARGAVAARVVQDGRLNSDLADLEQRRVHGLSWIATTVQALAQSLAWAARLADDGRLGEPERLVLRIGFGEYLAHLVGGLPMSQNEIVRPANLGLLDAAARLHGNPAVIGLLADGNTAETRKALVDALLDGGAIDESFDETLDAVRAELRAFTADRIAPHARGWHLADALIPDAVLDEMAALGVFGISVDPEHGGSGLGKLAVCAATEELSRGWIAAGSLATRSEIAAELIANCGTLAQQQHWLPRIASGEVLPTAVFTEPDIGSDLAHLTARAERAADDSWRVVGNNMDYPRVAQRPDDPAGPHRPGRGGPHRPVDSACAESNAERPSSRSPIPRWQEVKFPCSVTAACANMSSGSTVSRRRQTRFSATPRTRVSASSWRPSKAARIQTAARAVGVARQAFDLGLRYAQDRRQFSRALVAFPRVADKLAMMATEIVMARELTYFAAREKDGGRRCDMEAGMAKLLAARVAWSNADTSLQIHGGNGYALEFEISRVLCDARILNLFEGSAEFRRTSWRAAC